MLLHLRREAGERAGVRWRKSNPLTWSRGDGRTSFLQSRFKFDPLLPQLGLGFPDVLECAGLKPAAAVRQAEQTVMREGRVPKNFD